LNLWGNEHFISLHSKFSESAFPIIYPSLFTAGKNHWHQQIRRIATCTIKICIDIDTFTLSAIASSNAQYSQRENGPDAQKQLWISTLGQDIIIKANNCIE
jgi:hypothetical protein